jgi:hypothetical protein
MNDFSIEKIQEKPNETKRYIQRLAEELWKTHPKVLIFFNEAIISAERQIVRKKTATIN